MEQYLETGMVSIAADTVLLPAACFLTPRLPTQKMKPAFYEDATKLLMTCTRLLNDIQSYQVSPFFTGNLGFRPLQVVENGVFSFILMLGKAWGNLVKLVGNYKFSNLTLGKGLNIGNQKISNLILGKKLKRVY